MSDETMRDGRHGREYIFRPAWRAFYLNMIAMMASFGAGMVLINETPIQFRRYAWLLTVGLCVMFFSGMLLKRLGTVLVVRDDEVAYETGIFRRQSVEMGRMSIRTVVVNQTMIQRILGVGDIAIASSGTDGYEIVVLGIGSPYFVRNKIQGQV